MQTKIISTKRQKLDLRKLSAEAAYLLRYFAPFLNDKQMRQLSIRIAGDLSKEHKGLYEQYLLALKKADQNGGADNISSIISSEGLLLTTKTFVKEFFEMLAEHEVFINYSILDESTLPEILSYHKDNLSDYKESQLADCLNDLRQKLLLEILSISGFIYLNYGDSKDDPIIPFFDSLPAVKSLQNIDRGLELINLSNDLDLGRIFVDLLLQEQKHFLNYLTLIKRLLILSRITKDSSYAKIIGHLQRISPNDMKVLAVFKENSLGKQIGPDKYISTGLKVFLEADNNYYVLRLDTPHKGEQNFHINIEQFDQEWKSKMSTAPFFVNELAEKGDLNRSDLVQLIRSALSNDTNLFEQQILSKEFQHSAIHIPMTVWDKNPGQYKFFIDDYLKHLNPDSLIYGTHQRDNENITIVVNKSVAPRLIKLALNSFLSSGQIDKQIKALIIKQVLSFSKIIDDQEYLELYFNLAIEDEKDFLLETAKIFKNYIFNSTY